MKLQKAIERSETIIIKGELGDVLTAYPAIQLLIEAGKARKQDREFGYVDLDDLLPGETEE